MCAASSGVSALQLNQRLDGGPEPPQTVPEMIDQLGNYLGDQQKAESAIVSVLDDLNDTYDDQQIIPTLGEEVQSLLEQEELGKRTEAVIGKLSASIGSEFKARRAVAKVFEDVSKLYKQREIVYALETHAKSIEKETADKKP